MPYPSPYSRRPPRLITALLLSVRRRLFLFLVLAAFVALLFTALTLLFPARYRAQALLAYQPGRLADVSELLLSLEPRHTPGDRLQIDALRLRGRPLVEAAIEEGGFDITPEELRDHLVVEEDAWAGLVVVEVESHRSDEAAAIANTLSGQLIELRGREIKETFEEAAATITELRERYDSSAILQHLPIPANTPEIETFMAGLSSDYVLAEPAVPPDGPVFPRTALSLSLGLALGFMFSLGVVFHRDLPGGRLDRASDLRRALGDSLPVFELPRPPGAGESKDFLGFRHDPAALDRYRYLREELRLLGLGELVRVLGVVSAAPSAPRSFVAAHLALVLALREQRVLLVEADLRGGILPQVFAVSPREDRLDVLQGSASLGPAVSRVNLAHLLPVGLSEGEETESLNIGTLDLLRLGPSDHLRLQAGPKKFGRLMSQVRSSYDLVLVDLPPILVSGEAEPFLGQMGDIVLVAEKEDSLYRDVARSSVLVSRFGVPLLAGLFLEG